MPRPRASKTVSRGLQERLFKPRGIPLAETERIRLTLDELEAIRLADREGLYQEEAAERMGVSRATYARILASARRSVADFLVNGKSLEVAGGVVEKKGVARGPCPVHGHPRRRGRNCICEERPGDRAGRE
jgi:predicted DNA-binding protein (UPF0251 family)